MKKPLAFLGAIIITLQAIGQSPAMQPINRTINSTILHQALNDFNRTVPLFFFFPGFFFIGSVSYQNNPLFMETDFFEDEKTPDFKDYYQKEIFAAITDPMIPYIPKDSAMEVRFIDGNKLIFELSFKWDGDTLLLEQINSSKGKSKTVKYVNNKVISSGFRDKENLKQFNEHIAGDTLRILEWIDNGSASISKKRTEIRYRNGFPYEKRHSNSVQRTFIPQTITSYIYNEEQQLVLQEVKNSKGKIKYSINYLYHDNKLTNIEKKGKSSLATTSYSYDETGQLQSKITRQSERVYSTITTRKEQNYNEFEFISGSPTPQHKIFGIKTNSGNQIAEMKLSDKTDYASRPAETRWLLDYNNQGNISHIKVLNENGKIVKNITIEYIYFKI